MRGTPSKAINITTKDSFCAITGIEGPFNLTVHYFIVGHYLQSRHHQCSLLSLSRRGTHSHSLTQSLETTTRNKFERTTKAQHDLKLYARQGHFVRPEKAQFGLTFPSLLHIWSGMRRFQSQYKECNIYGIPITFIILHNFIFEFPHFYFPQNSNLLYIRNVFNTLPVVLFSVYLSGHQFLLHGDIHHPCCLHACIHPQQMEQESDSLHSQGRCAGIGTDWMIESPSNTGH